MESKKNTKKGNKSKTKTMVEDMLFTNKIVKKGLRNVASHHVESFNYAMETCLPRINQYMLTAEVAAQSDQQEYPFKKLNIWFEDF